MELTAQRVDTMKRYTHVYLAREDGDFDYLLTLTEERRDVVSNIVQVLDSTGEEVVVVDSDDEPVDVLCFHVAGEERITA